MLANLPTPFWPLAINYFRGGLPRHGDYADAIDS